MKHIIPFFILTGAVFIFSPACNPRDRVPREFPDKEEMAHILADLYLTENMLNHGTGGMYNLSQEDKTPGFYKSVLEKYDLTTQEFDTIRKWYAAHPYHFQKVYDQTIVLLSQREAELKRQIAAVEEEKLLEIKDLWEGPRELTTQLSDTLDARLPFSLAVDSITSGSLKLTAFFKLLKENMTRSASMMLVAHYADSTMDTAQYKLPISFQKKPASLTLPLDTSKTNVSVSGLLFDHDTTSNASLEVSGIRLEHVPANGGTLNTLQDANP